MKVVCSFGSEAIKMSNSPIIYAGNCIFSNCRNSLKINKDLIEMKFNPIAHIP